jgi:hypothetical protein
LNTTDKRTIVTDAFDAWSAGTGYVSSIFADTMTWEIVGHSAAAGTAARDLPGRPHPGQPGRFPGEHRHTHPAAAR